MGQPIYPGQGPYPPQGYPPPQQPYQPQGQQPYPQQPYPPQGQPYQGQQPYPPQSYPPQQFGPSAGYGAPFGYTQPQQGQPDQPSSPPAPPSGPSARAPRRASSKEGLKVIAGVVFLVGLCGFGVFAKYSGLSDKWDREKEENRTVGGLSASRGDCAEVLNNKSTSPSLFKVDCSDPKATLVLDSKGSAECAKEYYSYSQSQRDGMSYMCFARHLQEGLCYSLPDVGEWEPVTCASGSSADTYKVKKKIEGKNDPDLCDEGDTVYSYPSPLLTYCLGAPS